MFFIRSAKCKTLTRSIVGDTVEQRVLSHGWKKYNKDKNFGRSFGSLLKL